jgi:hypothetical protein
MFTTTRQAGCLNPIRVAEAPVRGPLLGVSLTSDLPVTLSLHELYRQGVITAPNAVILGHYGIGKSTLIKGAYVLRALAVGARGCVFDRKLQQDGSSTQSGEYLRLAQVAGGTRVVLDRRCGCRINIFDPMLSAHGSDDGLVGQDELLTMVTEVALRRALDDKEEFVLPVAHSAGLRVAENMGRAAELADVINALYLPDSASIPGPEIDGVKALEAAGVVSRRSLIEWGLPVALALEKYLPGGELSGLIDGQTRDADGGPLDLSARLLVFDTSALTEGSTALALMLMIVAAYLQAYWMRIPGDKILVLEEAYNFDLLIGIAAMLRTITKRGRASGTAVVSALHHLSDPKTGSDLWALVKETDVAHLFRQASTEDAKQIAEFFRLSDRAAALLPLLPRGCHLLKIAEQPLQVVQQIRTVQETWMTSTDDGMAGSWEEAA